MKPNIGQGDGGKTNIFGTKDKAWKDDPRVIAYGTCDSLNSLLGHIRAVNRHAELDALLEKIQQDLFIIQTLLAAHHEDPRLPRLTQEHIFFLEQKIQETESQLPELAHFILPGGTETAALLHRARTAARELERAVTTFYKIEGYLTETESNIPPYLTYLLSYANRLSDVFFALARLVNFQEGKDETEWKGINR